MMWVLLDGQIVPSDQARVPVLSRALLYGDGLFETMRAYRARLFDLDRHLDRIERSAAELDLPKAQLASLLGTIPETLSRILSRMTREGLIESPGGRTIRLLDRQSLEELARGESRLA